MWNVTDIVRMNTPHYYDFFTYGNTRMHSLSFLLGYDKYSKICNNDENKMVRFIC